MKKVPVVKITTSDAGVGLAGLPLAATVAMADVAAAMREGLLAFSTAAGLVVMQQMLTEELASIVGPKHARRWSGRELARHDDWSSRARLAEDHRRAAAGPVL